MLDELFAIHAYGMAHILKSRGVPYVIFGTTLFQISDTYRQSLGKPFTWSTFQGVTLGQSWVSRPTMYTPPPADSSDKYSVAKFTERTVNVMENAGEMLSLAVAGTSGTYRLTIEGQFRSDRDRPSCTASWSKGLLDGQAFARDFPVHH